VRHKDVKWSLPEGKRKPDGGTEHRHDDIQIAVLMDIRDELQRLNELLYCSNFVGMPHTLKRIDRRLAAHAPLKKGRA
jgi:hypothetical protein